MKDKTEKKFFYIAVVSFGLALIAHILSLLHVNLQALFPPIMLLHVVVFVVWIPAVLKQNKIKKEYKLEHGEYPKITILNLGKFLPNTPKIMFKIIIFFFIYGIVNFLIFMTVGEGGGPSIIDGKYVLSSHGDIIREITLAEYSKFQANEVRGFSGLWMVFYMAAIAMLFPKKL